MKRRDFLHGLAVAPAVAVPALQQAPAPPAPTSQAPTPATPQAPAPAQTPSTPPPPAAVPVLDTTPSDAAATTVTRFFTAPQAAALHRLSDVLVPRLDGAPGALDAGAPAFLDFLIGKSPAERQALYRDGLDALQAQARQRFNTSFETLTEEQASQLLAPLREPWTFAAPKDPLAAFLRAAKQDVRTATQNSLAAADAARAAGGRGGGVGLYWYEVV